MPPTVSGPVYRRRWRAACLLVSAAVALSLSASGCGVLGGGRPKGAARTDVKPEAYLVYPGARETARYWTAEETARGIDGNDLSKNTKVIVEYALDAPASRRTVWTWYERELTSRGWRSCSDAGSQPRTMCQQIGNRRHQVHMDPNDTGQTVSEFQIFYIIGWPGEFKSGP